MKCSNCFSLPSIFGQSKPKKRYFKQGKCVVCVGMDNDHSIKQVEYCVACEELICDACIPRWWGRGFLAIKKTFRFE